MEENPIDFEEMLRQEKRKVFWKLYSLPWILLTISLLFTCVIMSHPWLKKEGLKELLKGSTMSSEAKAYSVGQNDIGKVLEAKLDEREADITFRAIHQFQVEAVSNGMARWKVAINGDRSFEWKTNLVEVGIEREYPFMIGDMSIARNIGLNIEKELSRGIRQVVEAHFLGKDEGEKKKLEGDIDRVIKTMFDGIENYKKEMK